MALRINNDRVSSRPWGSIDEAALRQRLKRALQPPPWALARNLHQLQPATARGGAPPPRRPGREEGNQRKRQRDMTPGASTPGVVADTGSPWTEGVPVSPSFDEQIDHVYTARQRG